MSTTMTGRFDDVDQAHAARETMMAGGIAEANIVIDEQRQQISVIVPQDQIPQIREAFGLHGIDPTQ
jgi:hypothetical protein